MTARTSAVLMGVLGVILAVLVTKNVVLCNAELVPVTDARGWRTWPVLPGLGPFTLAHESSPCVPHRQACGLSETELRDPGVCPRCGVSLDAWYEPRGVHGKLDDIELRAHDDVYAVVVRQPPEATETLVVAFTREVHFRRPGLAGRSIESLFLALGLGALAVGAALARRYHRRARAYSDRTRFRPATDESDRVILDDDAEPYVLSEANVPPGRVLVRERSHTVTDYRTMRTIAAGDLVRVDPAAVLALAAFRSADARRIAFALALVCTTVAAVEAATTWVHAERVFEGD